MTTYHTTLISDLASLLHSWKMKTWKSWKIRSKRRYKKFGLVLKPSRRLYRNNIKILLKESMKMLRKWSLKRWLRSICNSSLWIKLMKVVLNGKMKKYKRLRIRLKKRRKGWFKKLRISCRMRRRSFRLRNLQPWKRWKKTWDRAPKSKSSMRFKLMK